MMYHNQFSVRGDNQYPYPVRLKLNFQYIRNQLNPKIPKYFFYIYSVLLFLFEIIIFIASEALITSQSQWTLVCRLMSKGTKKS